MWLWSLFTTCYLNFALKDDYWHLDFFKDFTTRTAGTYKALINFSSQQYIIFSGCIRLICPLPSCPPQSSQLFCSHSLPYLLPSLPVFLSPFSPQDTLMLLLLHSSLSECQPVFFFPSRPQSSPLFTAVFFPVPQTQTHSSLSEQQLSWLSLWMLSSSMASWKPDSYLEAKPWPNSAM